jgi:hypothetical protein
LRRESNIRSSMLALRVVLQFIGSSVLRFAAPGGGLLVTGVWWGADQDACHLG